MPLGEYRRIASASNNSSLLNDFHMKMVLGTSIIVMWINYFFFLVWMSKVNAYNSVLETIIVIVVCSAMVIVSVCGFHALWVPKVSDPVGGSVQTV